MNFVIRPVIRSARSVGIFMILFVVIFLAVDSLLVPRLFDVRRPAAYSESVYWSEAFDKESSLVADLRSVRRTSMGEVSIAADYESRYFNIKDGLRRTLPSPVNPTRRIIAHGGSTTFCVEVPDDLTWPSQLARRVLAKEVEVINAGLSGAKFADRVNAFRGLGLAKPGDIAIFFVGVNDAVLGEQENQVVGPLARWPKIRRALEATMDWSNSGRIALKRSQQLSFNITADSSEAVHQFRQSLLEAERFAVANKVRLLVVLQPSQLTETKPVWGSPNDLVEKRYKDSFVEFYSQILTSIEFKGRVIDGTQMFNSLVESPYLDFVHVQEDGNEAIAKFFYAELERRGWLD